MENYKDSVAFNLELKNLLLQLTDVYKVSASPYLEKVEDLTKQAVNRKKDFLAIVIELFKFEEKNELIEVILMNFVLKLMREYFDRIPQSENNINEIINSTVDILRVSYSDPFFTSKMLEFLRLYFGLPLAYITLENTQKLWKILKVFLRIQEDFLTQMSHDMAIKCIKAFFVSVKEQGSGALSEETNQIVIFILGEITKEIAELVASLKKETQVTLRKEFLRSLENLCGGLLFCLELLVYHDLSFMNDLLLNDVLYNIMQLGDIEDSSILSLNLSFHSLFWKFKNNSSVDIQSLIGTIFNQTIMRPLQKFSTKFLSNQIKERDIFNLHHLISYLIQFLQNKEYVNFIYANNDLTSLKKPLYDEILVNVFKIAKRAAESSSQSYSREIFDIILEFLYGSLEIDESKTLHLENISIEDKDRFSKLLDDAKKWENYAVLLNEDPKKFLKEMDKYYSQETMEEKAEKVSYFLHLSHHIPSGKIIEILGVDKPFNRELLKKYMVALDFTDLDVLKAMRLLFINFLMFGEAQVVERVLAAFCEQYYASNSNNGIFKSSGPVHTFTYAIIMLNTDLYKPILKEKMSIEAFVTNCRHINDGDDLPEEYLRSCYNSLKQYEIKTLASRDLSHEENVTYETWKNYLKTIQMYDSESAKIYSKNDNFVDPKDIKDLHLLIDYHCHKKIILKMIENLDLFLTKAFLDPTSIDLLLDKIVKVCVHYEMLENLDNIMMNMDKKFESNPGFDLAKMNDTFLWNLFCTFLFIKKALVYLQDSINVVAKLLVKTFELRKYSSDDKIGIKYTKRYQKIKQSSKFVAKAIYKNSSFFEAFLGFVSKEEVSSEEEDSAKVLQRVEYQNKGVVEKLALHKKFYNEHNIFEDIYDQTKFLPDQHIVKFFNSLVNDTDILEAIKKDPSLLISLNATLFEVAARNYDRPHIFWNVVASTFIHISLVDNKSKSAEDKLKRERLNELFELSQSKLGMTFEPLLQKKTRKLSTMKLFIHYSLLDLCLKFCHQAKDLPGFEEVLDYTLECLTEYSNPILLEFINMIQEVINSYQFTESQNLVNWVYVLRILGKMLEAIEKNSTGVADVKDTCLQYSELLNDVILKLSFLTDSNFTPALQELTNLLKRFQASEITKQFQLFSKVINNFYLLIVSIEKKKANEFLRASIGSPEVVLAIYDLAHKFVLGDRSVDVNVALKLFQKVLYLLHLDFDTNEEQIKQIIEKLNEIKKKLISLNDEISCLAYIEMLRKFLLSHIEKVTGSVQKEMMLSFYSQSHEMYSLSIEKNYQTLMETLLAYVTTTTKILIDLNILSKDDYTKKITMCKGNKEENNEAFKGINDIIDKFPKEKVEPVEPVEPVAQEENVEQKDVPKELNGQSEQQEQKEQNGEKEEKEEKGQEEGGQKEEVVAPTESK